jgi:hypothetical protein
MGGTASATIKVKLDDSSKVTFPGAQMKGRVYLMVHKERVEAESIMLRITGGEYTCIVLGGRRSDGDTTPLHYYVSTALFLDIAFPLTVVRNGFFLKGQYEFPFVFTLPTGILPTMIARSGPGSDARCEVRYEIETKLHRRGWMKWAVEGFREFIVLANPMNDIPSFSTYLPPVKYPLTFMCFNVGNVCIGLSSENGLIAAGEGFDVNFVVENNSKKAIKAIQLEVFEIISWTATKRTVSKTNILFLKRFEQGDLEFALSKNTNSSGSNNDVKTLAELNEILDSGRFRQHFTIPADAFPTVQGKLLRVQHFVKLTVFTSYGTSDIEILSKIIVHRCGLPTPSQQQFWSQNPHSARNPAIYPEFQPQQQFQPQPQQHQQKQHQQLPSDWHAVVAEATMVPTPQFAIAVVVVNDRESPGPCDYTVIPPPVNYQGIDNLFQVLSRTYDPPGQFIKWCFQRKNKVESLTPEHFAKLFKILKNPFDQIKVVNLLVEAHSEITCAHIAAAISTCSPLLKVDVVKKLSVNCRDKQQYKAVVRSKLESYEWTRVENCFSKK